MYSDREEGMSREKAEGRAEQESGESWRRHFKSDFDQLSNELVSSLTL